MGAKVLFDCDSFFSALDFSFCGIYLADKNICDNGLVQDKITKEKNGAARGKSTRN